LHLFPDVPIYTLFYDPKATGNLFLGKEIRTSFLQRVPLIHKYHRVFPLFMPIAIEQFNFSEFDLVISISASFAKGIVTGPNTRHISYCLTPPRFLWDDSQKFIEDFSYPSFIKKALPPMITYLRIWDREASMRVDEFWSISKFVKERVKKYYGRDSELIYPPVDVSKFQMSYRGGDYFFMAGRLVPYKRFDLAVRAFNTLGLPLKIAGTGPEFNRLKKIAGKNIQFLGSISDKQLAKEYTGSRALIFPQEEDFGITPLEAMASGKPVIAFRGGGAVETIKEHETGMFFNEQSEDSLIDALHNFKDRDFNPFNCRVQAEKFDLNVFKRNILNKVNH
jgi:glycosyltransferase involved in cell wall biosynthesis